MTYRELIKEIGWENFSKYGKGWYDLEFTITNGLDYNIDRYALMGMLPFYEINQEYNIEYEKDMDHTGSTYDWLSSNIRDEEELNKRITRMKEYLKTSFASH